MKVILFTLICLLISHSVFGQPNYAKANSEVKKENTLTQKPAYFNMNWKPGILLKPKITSIIIKIDSLGEQNINLYINESNEPLLYSADITTAVCADGECRLMHLRLYWNLLGGYAGYDQFPGLPLTKNDHDEFLEKDYLKLHELLMDNNSILKRKKIDELVVKTKKTQIGDVDAISGATIKEVKESVVKGGLYSCYTAWHLVHGDIQADIKKHTLSLLNKNMKEKMLNSNDFNYQLFVLNRINEEEFVQNNLQISKIFKKGIPLIRSVIVKNLPKAIWDSHKLQQPFWDSYAVVDINSRSLLMEHLGSVSEKILEQLSNQLSIMTKNQLKLFLKSLENNPVINNDILDNLMIYSNSEKANYSYIVTSFLEGN